MKAKDTYRKYVNETREQIAGLTKEELELRKEFFAAYYADSSPDKLFAWVMQKIIKAPFIQPGQLSPEESEALKKAWYCKNCVPGLPHFRKCEVQCERCK